MPRASSSARCGGESQRGDTGEFGPPYNVITKQLISVNPGQWVTVQFYFSGEYLFLF